MSKTYKSYNEEFKKTIVTLYESGKRLFELSREYGINESNIRTLINRYGTITTSTGEVTNNDEICSKLFNGYNNYKIKEMRWC